LALTPVMGKAGARYANFSTDIERIESTRCGGVKHERIPVRHPKEYAKEVR
jgi:hypothetical protein